MKNEAQFLIEIDLAINILGDMAATMQAALEGVARVSKDELVHKMVRDTLVFVADRTKDLDEVRKRGVALCAGGGAAGG